MVQRSAFHIIRHARDRRHAATLDLALRLTTNQRGEVILTSTPVADLTRPTSSDPLCAYQKDGTTAAGNSSTTVTLALRGHRAAFAGERISGLPDGFVGVLDLTSSTPFVALTLRSRTNSGGDFLLTTFPIANVNASPATPVVFPHIADGGGYQTQIILLNTTGGAKIAVGYFEDSGAPLAVGVRQ